MIKKTLSSLMAILMVFTMIPLTGIVAGAEDASESALDANCTVNGNGSFGNMMADAFNTFSDEQTEASEYAVTSVVVDEDRNAVAVETNNASECQIIIGVYDDSGETLLFSQSAPSGNEESQDILLNNQLPEHYVVKAVETDVHGNQLSQVLEDYTNTRRYEAYENSTTNDYSENRVINLNEDATDNYLVILDGVQILTPDRTDIQQANESTRTYTFSKSNQTKGLTEGDVFVYNSDDLNQVIIGKVTDVDSNKDSITIQSEEPTVDEVFETVKIHFEDDYMKLVDDGEPVVKAAADYEGDMPVSKTYPFSFGPVNGSATISANVHVEFEYDLKLFGKDYAYAKIKTSPTATIQASINYNYNKEIPLPKLSASLWGGAVEIGMSMYVVIKASLKINFHATIKATYGFSWSTTAGLKKLNEKPTVDTSVEIDGSFYLGLKVAPYFSAGWGLCKATITAEAGGKISAHSGWSYTTGQTTKHDCGLACIYAWIDIPISIKANLTINIFGWKPVDKTWDLWSKTFSKVYDFHYSIKYHEFGRGECGHLSYLITFKVQNENGKPISGANVDGTRTASDGTAKIWYSEGRHNIKVSANGYCTEESGYGFSSPRTVTVTLEKGSSGTVKKKTDSSYSSYVKKTRSSANGYGNSGSYVAPLTYTEPAEGVVLSTRLSGQRRSDVAWVQRELKNLGYNITADGYYGNLTAAVVRQFQQDYSLPVTGTVNANVVAVIKKPVKAVTEPVLRLTTNPDIPSGGIATVAWDNVTNATNYNVYAYNSRGQLAASAVGTKANTASFVLYEADEYTVKAVSGNDRFTSSTATLNQKIRVHNPSLVTFVDWDGTVLSKQFVEYGKSAVTPASPERDGYTFSKWDKAYTNLTDAELTITAQYTRNRYTVKFMDVKVNGSDQDNVIASDKYYLGESAQAPDPSQLSIPQGYSFIGWDKDFSNIIEDITIRPVLEWTNNDLPILITSYVVTKDQGYGYDVSLTVQNYEKQRTTGRVVVALKTESGRFITMTESSAFTLAKSNVSAGTINKETFNIFVPCKENVAYVDIFVVAAYSDLIPISEVKRFTVGEATENEGVEHAPIAGQVDASLAGKQAILFIYKIDEAADFTNEYIGQSVIGADGSYSFNYRLREEPTPETGDYTVVLGIEGADGAIFLDTIQAPRKTFTVTIKNADGSVLDTQLVQEGDSAVLPTENPVQEGYRFAGWDYSNSSIHEDLTITAIYVPKTYTVVFIDWTNERFDMKTYQHGEPIDSKDLALSSLVDYDAIGWEGVTEGMPVTENMVITAKYEKKHYTVKFYDYEGNVVDEQTVAYGDDVKAPELTEDDIHVFFGWDVEDIVCVTEPLEVHPYFSFAQSTDVPTASIQSGVYDNTVSVALTCETADADIYYSLNGGNYRLYTSPIQIDQTAELEAFASSFGKNDSDSLTAYYVINRAGEQTEWKAPVQVYVDGSPVGTYLLAVGSILNATSLPVAKEGHTLEGFYYDSEMTQSASGDNVQQGTVVYAKFNADSFTVQFKDADGTVLDTQTVTYFEAAVAPQMLVSVNDLIFVGWDTEDFYCVTADLTVTAVYAREDEIVGISLNRDSYTMMEGYSYTLTAKTVGSGIHEIFWESSDESIAVVDENGKVTALSDGFVVITATALGETSASATCYIQIERNPDYSITLNSNSTYSIAEGYVCGISPSSNTVADVKEQIQSTNVNFFDGEVEMGTNDVVKTGCTVSYYDADGNKLDTLVLVVTGDVDGDGLVSTRDASHIMRHIINKEKLETSFLMAADVNADGGVNNRDASLILKVVAQKESI